MKTQLEQSEEDFYQLTARHDDIRERYHKELEGLDDRSPEELEAARLLQLELDASRFKSLPEPQPADSLQGDLF
jgi:hypothetical protein